MSANSSLPAVTVVIPAYNMARFVERSIRSALAQTYSDFSVQVVDDGSTDGTLAICEALADQHPALTVVTGPNNGVAAARNRGTELAGTDYVAFLDADDLWHPTKLEKQMARLLAHGPQGDWAACYTLFRAIDEDDRLVFNGYRSGPSGAFFEEHLRENHVGNGSSLLVRRDVALELGGFDPGYAARGIGGCEDFDFQLKLLRRYKMDLVPEYLVGYRLSDGQMSNHRTRMGRALIAVTEKFIEEGRVSPALRVAALTSAHGYAASKFLRVGDWRNLARSAGTIASIAPARGLAMATGFAARKVRNLAARLRGSAARRRRTFYDYDPNEGSADLGKSITSPDLP